MFLCSTYILRVDCRTNINRDKLILTPLMMSNLKNCPKPYLIAQKKRPDALKFNLNASQKTQVLYKLWFLKKSRKTIEKTYHVWPFGLNEYFLRFFLIFSKTILCKEMGFFALHSVH